MAKIIVFNNDTNRMETYYRGENEAMPYNTNRSLTVGEFRGSSGSPTLWMTKRAMQSWNATRYLYGAPIPVGIAFKRPWEGGHSNQSQHYAGVAFDVAQTLSNSKRNRLRNLAIESEVWSYGAPVRRLGYSRWEADLVKSSQQLVSRFWSRSREVRFKRKSERVRAVMRKRETIEPR